jgi:hypothetical protein
MATGNSRIIIGNENEWGDGGGSNKSAVVLRRTSFKVDPSRPELTSGEMRGDPFRAPSRLGATEIKGEFGIELVPGAHDFILAAAVHNEWQGNTLKAGDDFSPRSLFLEHRTFGKHILYKGVVIEKMTLAFEPNSLVKGTVSFLAKDRTELDASSVPESKIEAAPETMAAANWDGVFKVDGVQSQIMTALSLDITRAAFLRMVLGDKYPTSAHISKFDVTGEMTIRPTDTSAWNDFHEEKRNSLEVTLFGVPNTLSYTFKMGRLLKTSSAEELSDPEDLLISSPFGAEVDPATKVPLIITRSHAAAEPEPEPEPLEEEI